MTGKRSQNGSESGKKSGYNWEVSTNFKGEHKESLQQEGQNYCYWNKLIKVSYNL